MNILVTGANGQLGNEMQIVARESDDTFLFTDICDGFDKLDIANFEAVRQYVRAHDVKCIVNCAAWTNVDGAEDPGCLELVESLNATAPGNLAKAMKEVGGLLVHISTDYVFGAEPYNTPCSEDRQGTPTGVYGLTKLHGEQNIRDVFGSPSDGLGAFIIIRTAWLYSEFGKNFVKTMLNLTATKPELNVVFDQAGTPTYALDLAKAILHIIMKVKKDTSGFTLPSCTSGVYHFSNEGVCSWFDFTKMIAEYAGNSDCTIKPCHSSEYPSKVKRPSYSVLDKTKIKETFGLEIPYWTDSLKTCISNLNNR